MSERSVPHHGARSNGMQLLRIKHSLICSERVWFFVSFALVMSTPAMDTALLASYCSFSEQYIQTLIDSPSSDLVTSFFENLIAKAKEHDRLKADHLRLDVELENAVRGGESRTRALKANTDKALKDIEALRIELNEKG